MSHCVKICSVTNRLNMAKKIIQELYTYNKEIDRNIWIDVIMNIAYYSLHTNLAKFYIPNYFVIFLCYNWLKINFIKFNLIVIEF